MNVSIENDQHHQKNKLLFIPFTHYRIDMRIIIWISYWYACNLHNNQLFSQQVIERCWEVKYRVQASMALFISDYLLRLQHYNQHRVVVVVVVVYLFFYFILFFA